MAETLTGMKVLRAVCIAFSRHVKFILFVLAAHGGGGEVSVRLTPDKYLLDASGGVFLVLRPIKVAPKMHRGVILT
ncbi:MAG: hypothetical protein J6T02_04425 [Bacteroidales bacterium]|nr:hypothetical protein [Bacteroidales bacterium]